MTRVRLRTGVFFVPAEREYAFSHFVDGLFEVQDEPPLPKATRLILLNPGEESGTGTGRFQDAQGNPAFVPVDGVLTDTATFQVAARGIVEIETSGEAPRSAAKEFVPGCCSEFRILYSGYWLLDAWQKLT